MYSNEGEWAIALCPVSPWEEYVCIFEISKIVIHFDCKIYLEGMYFRFLLFSELCLLLPSLGHIIFTLLLVTIRTHIRAFIWRDVRVRGCQLSSALCSYRFGTIHWHLSRYQWTLTAPTAPTDWAIVKPVWLINMKCWTGNEPHKLPRKKEKWL